MDADWSLGLREWGLRFYHILCQTFYDQVKCQIGSFCSNKEHLLSSSFSELPVKILGKPDAKTEKQFLVSDDIILVCELSRANASVSWYKDSKLIDDNERYCIEEQGVFRSLVVLNAGTQDSGEYTCDAVGDKMVFYITVKGNINHT